MGLEIQTGEPSEEGRYVVWTPCAARQVREWCEPHIATWHAGKWIFYDPVWAWIGPLPVVHGNDCLKKIEERGPERTWDEVFNDKDRTEGGAWKDRPKQEYDL